MNNLPIRLLVILGTLSMSAIIGVQVFWVSKAIDNNEEQFNRSVQMAMRNVVESLCEINGNDIPSNDPIDQLSSNYFIARTNYRIDLNSLDYLLRAELQKRNIEMDYEYGVYDCQTDRMVYGDYVKIQETSQVTKSQLPLLAEDEYYFGVFFPSKKAGIVSSLGLWKVTSGLTLLILISFAYALFVILRQKRLSEVQRDFINNMTHEFKTPLATLRIATDVLQKEAQSDRQVKYTVVMKSEIQRLEDHVHRLLETASVDRSKAEGEQVDLGDLVKSILRRLGKDNWNIKVKTTQEPISIFCDRTILETCIFNLIDNAIKYGRSYVTIETEKVNRTALLTIENDGSIPRKDQGKVFDKFYRVPKGDLHDVKGFGLGLYFVKKAVRVLGGKIALKSSDDTTSFQLTLPIHGS